MMTRIALIHGAVVAVMALSAVPAMAVDELLEDAFTSPTLGGWGGGSESYSNPGAGGVAVGDPGYLRVANDLAPTRLATRNTLPAYLGNYPAAGVRRVMFYLNDVGDADPGLEIHFGIGIDQSNFWLLNEAFIPPHNEWELFIVDLENTDFTQWTQIGFAAQSAAAFQAALASVGRVLIRHDDYADGADGVVFNDDFIQADVGVDRFMIVVDCQTGAITGADCNSNGEVDECDIAIGGSRDEDGDGVPDECGAIDGDLDGDGDVDIKDLLNLLSQWGRCPDPPDPCTGDLNGTMTVDIADLLILLSNWT